MFRILFKKILMWLREIWSLLKVIDDAISKHQQKSTSRPKNTASVTSTAARRNALQDCAYQSKGSVAVRHRYIELEGYAESLRIDGQGRYDLNQLARFTKNFIWVAPNDVTDFLDGIEHSVDYIDGDSVLWVDKADCIEWAYLQYSALAELL